MSNYENKVYELMLELGVASHERAKLEYELDIYKGVGATTVEHCSFLLNRVIAALNDDIYLQSGCNGSTSDAVNTIYKVKSILEKLNYGDCESSFDGEFTL